MQIQSIRVFHETPLFHSIFKIHNYIEGFHETSHIQNSSIVDNTLHYSIVCSQIFNFDF